MPSHDRARYKAVAGVLIRVLLLNVGVALAKIGFGYTSGAISILSDGFHSLTDAASNAVGLVGVRAASQPPDADHPYGHRKYETVAAAAVIVFLLLVLVEVLRNAFNRLTGRSTVPIISTASFAVMVGTVAVNVFVVWYESRAAARLASEVLLADAMQTRGDVWTSLTVITALAGARLGWPMLDPVAALVVAGFIGYAGFQIARTTTGILSDRIVIADARPRADRDDRAGRDRLPPDTHARLRRSRLSRSSCLVARRHAADRGARHLARGEGSADDPISADCGRDYSHRAAAARMNDWRDRFARLVDRKTAEAAHAALPPYHTALEQPPGDAVAIGNDFSRRVFDGPFYVSDAGQPGLPSASLVFVQSRDGNTGANDPSSIGGGATDAHMVYEGLSRAAADGVLAGAETIRGGDLVFSVWHPEIVRLRESLGLPRHPTQIVATLRGLSFDETLLYNVPEIRVIVLTVPGYAREMERELAARPWITPLVMHDANDLHAAFEALRKLGQSRISVVGGRTIARALVAADLIQDLYLTTSPKRGGEPNTPLFEKPIQSELIVQKHGTGPETGVVFEHRRLR